MCILVHYTTITLMPITEKIQSCLTNFVQMDWWLELVYGFKLLHSFILGIFDLHYQYSKKLTLIVI